MFQKKAIKFTDQEIRDAEEKCKKFKQEVENPHNKEFHDKLINLLNKKVDSRDSFINWLTGLTTGAIFLILNKISPGMDNRILFVLAISAFFLTILVAMLFKVFLEVRYSSDEFEIDMLKNVWEGHDIKRRIDDLLMEGKKIDEVEIQRFYGNLKDSIKYLDKDFLERSKRPVAMKSKLLSICYGLTVFLFFIGITLMTIYFILVMFKPA